MPTLLEVWESRLGVQEVRGPKHNPIIVQWAADAGHPEIVDDETSWCSLSMCSAAKAAGLPFPPRNVNPMARSWLTWGVKVKAGDIQPGDVAVWPRGNPKGPFGHVNCVKHVRERNGATEVRCIGGNQGGLAGGDAVTLSKWVDAGKALAFRRGVRASVKELRQAGSTTIRDADNLQKAGIFSTVLGLVTGALSQMFGKFEVPQFADISETVTWWDMLLGGANALYETVTGHPWLAGVVVVGLACFFIGRHTKTGRVEEHAAGIPIASQVTELEPA